MAGVSGSLLLDYFLLRVHRMDEHDSTDRQPVPKSELPKTGKGYSHQLEFPKNQSQEVGTEMPGLCRGRDPDAQQRSRSL